MVTVAGVALGYLLAKGRFPGRGAIETVFSLPMALPPTVVGYYLLTRLGGPGPIRDAEVHLFVDALSVQKGNCPINTHGCLNRQSRDGVRAN